MAYHFDDYILDLSTGELRGPSGTLPLRPQTFTLLRVLIEQAPALIDRDSLIDQVWGRSALSRNVLPQAISELRQILGDDPAAPRYIETRHRRGYRFIAPVQRMDAAVAAPAAEPAPGPAPDRFFIRPGPILATVIALSLAIGLWHWMTDDGAITEHASGLEQTRMRLMAERRQAEAQADPESAVSALRGLVALDPADVDLRLDLVEAELAVLQGGPARQTLAGLDQAEAGARALRLQSRIARLDGQIDVASRLSAAALEQALKTGDRGQLFAALSEQLVLLRSEGQLPTALEQVEGLLDAAAGPWSPAEATELELLRLGLLRETGALDAAGQSAQRLTAQALTGDLSVRRTIEIALLESERGDQASALRTLEVTSGLVVKNPSLALQLDNAWATILARSGALDEALQRFEQGFSAARQRGAVMELATLQVNAGLMFARQRRMGEAEVLWQEALAVFEALGDRRGQGIVLGNLAAVASSRGQIERSNELNGRALALFRDLGLAGPRARTAFNLGLARARAGELAAAAELYAEAAEHYQAAGQRDLLAHVTAVRAELLLEGGETNDALALIESLDDAGPISEASRAHLLSAQARLAQRDGDLELAGQHHRAALALRKQARQERWAAQSELDLLRVDLLDGRNPAEIRIEAEILAERFERWEELRSLARARALVAEALLVQGRIDDARAALLGAREAARRFPDVLLDLDLAWVEAWVEHTEEFVPRLQALAARAEDLGLYNHQLRALQILARFAAGGEAGLALAGPWGGEPLPPYTLLR